MTFLALADAFGRPVYVRADTVAAIEGAVDAEDPAGDLWGSHPPAPYQRITLTSGARLYLTEDAAQALLKTFEPTTSRYRPDFPHLSHHR